MAHPSINRELVNSGVNFTNIDINEGYVTQSNLPLHGAGENNLLPLQTINSDYFEKALASATPHQVYYHHLRTIQLT